LNWRNGRERKRNAAEKDERKRNTAEPRKGKSMNADREKTESPIETEPRIMTYTSPPKKIIPNGLPNGLALAYLNRIANGVRPAQVTTEGFVSS
jgi:hypothetical protein